MGADGVDVASGLPGKLLCALERMIVFDGDKSFPNMAKAAQKGGLQREQLEYVVDQEVGVGVVLALGGVFQELAVE